MSPAIRVARPCEPWPQLVAALNFATMVTVGALDPNDNTSHTGIDLTMTAAEWTGLDCALHRGIRVCRKTVILDPDR